MIEILLMYVIPFVIIFSFSTIMAYINYKRNKISYQTSIEISSNVMLALLYFMLLQAFFISII